MDLTGWLLRVAARRPHVLVVPVPGKTRTRLAVEAEIGRRGWPLADSPADADLLVVAGPAGPELAAVIETVWTQLPSPRARVPITEDADVADALDAAVRELADGPTQRRAPVGEPAPRNHGRRDAPADRDMPMEHNTSGADDMSGGHMHRGHGGGMEMPGGIPMAGLGEDRDGLMLDALHVPLGPLLPDWPAGLVLRVVLQGDVIREAAAEVLDPPESGSTFWTERGTRAGTVGEVARRAAAGHLDGLARLLGVAGWADPAARARRLRDALLAGGPAAEIVPPARELAARVGRSRTLRWLVRDIPAGERDVARRLADRIAGLHAALRALDDSSPAAEADLLRLAVGGAAVGPTELAALLVGAEFATARLVIAAVDPDLFTPAREASHRGHG